MQAPSSTLNIRRRLITMASVLALAAGTAAGVSAQEANGRQEGIKVHGHWIIEVKNPDGTRAQYREFENALVPSGGGALSQILGQAAVPSSWLIWFGDSTSTANPCIRVTFITSCSITTPLAAQGTVPTEYHPTISVTTPGTGPNAGTLVLSGSATSSSPEASVINFVMTQLRMCPANTLPGAGCPAAGFQANITQTAVTPAIPIVPGQIIQVTVIISFS